MDTSTETGRQKRIEELAAGYRETGNRRALTRLVGLSPSDWDNIPGYDDGEQIAGTND